MVVFHRKGPSEVIAETEYGAVLGFINMKGQSEFRGIPYAASPLQEELRFRRPIPPERWHYLRDCTTFGPSSPQPVSDYWGRPDDHPKAARPNGGNWYGLFAPTQISGDDFLNLNVTVPSGNEDRRPVVVYIHGGAFSLGNNAMPIYNGSNMADLGVVFVSINYRLGAEGFWPVEGGDTNIGLRDQIFALEWVQRNIREFGGDPHNVTLLGQSAGAGSIGLLSVSDHARHLFSRAIGHSSPMPGAQSRVAALENSRRVGAAIGIDATLAAAKQLNPLNLVERIHCAKLDPVAPCPHGRMDYSTIFVPMVDNDIVPNDYRERFRSVQDRRPIISGLTADESAWRVYQTGATDRWDDGDLLNYLGTLVDDPVEAREMFRKVYPGISPGSLRARVMYYDMYLRSVIPVINARSAAYRDSTFCFLFDEKSISGNGGYGAFHLADLPFLFNMLEHPFSISMHGKVGNQETADAMRSRWAAFFRGETPEWPSYSPDEETIKIFRNGGSTVVDRYGNEGLLEYWMGVRPVRR